MQRRNTLSQAFGEDLCADPHPEPTPQVPGPSSGRPLGPPMRAEGWVLAAYSRLIPGPVAPKPPGARVPNAPSSGSQQSGTTWKDFECSDRLGKLWMCITEAGNVSIMDGETALEQVSVYEAPCMTSLLHVFQKEEFIFFSSQVKTAGHTFRVKFDGETKEQAVEQSSNCATVLSSFITVLKMPTMTAEMQGGGNPTKPPLMTQLLRPARTTGSLPQVHFSDGTASMSQLAKLTSGTARAPFMPLASLQSPSFPSQQLGSMLRLCMLDPSFTAIVDCMEREINKITAEAHLVHLGMVSTDYYVVLAAPLMGHDPPPVENGGFITDPICLVEL